MTDPEAWAYINTTAKSHNIDPAILADACCEFPEGLTLWDTSPQTDGGQIKLYPDIEALECCARLLARKGKPDTAGDPLPDFTATVRCCDCRHWRPLDHHPDMGDCGAGCKPTGLYFWGETERRCQSFEAKP